MKTAAVFTRYILDQKHYEIFYGNPNSRCWKEDAQAKLMEVLQALGDEEYDKWVDSWEDRAYTWQETWQMAFDKLQEINQ